MTDLPRNDELVQAAVGGDLGIVKRLIEGGADPNSVDEHGMGPLLNAHPEVTRYLLEHGADPDQQRNENITPVLAAVTGNLECVRLMLDAGANVNRAIEHNGETALHFAVFDRLRNRSLFDSMQLGDKNQIFIDAHIGIKWRYFGQITYMHFC